VLAEKVKNKGWIYGVIRIYIWRNFTK
jgi:hypothetical protein